jgi:phosphoglycolate phosphatase-like HAD superfamily hydrolase
VTVATAVLWDIDGTLLRTPGIGVRAFVLAVERATGLPWTPRRLDFGGRTDPEIADLILEDVGLRDPALVPAVLDELTIAYDGMADELRAAVQVLPGVTETVATLAGRGVLQTVVTGNLRTVAEAKITAGQLGRHLRLDIGAYGSDHADRSQLVRLARQRIAATGADVRAGDVWVIGDTPRDVACAHANGVRCALVATGTYAPAELRELGADLTLDDLSAPEELLDALA